MGARSVWQRFELGFDGIVATHLDTRPLVLVLHVGRWVGVVLIHSLLCQCDRKRERIIYNKCGTLKYF